TQAVYRGELKVQLKRVRSGREVLVTVSDTGPGIPNDMRRKIFEPFFTTKARGTGLGLTVARRIIEEHRGSIQIESRQEKGTCFVISLPLNPEGGL
ncbi:MAG: histidine kinase, partial [Anaerolineae bacterium]|nr:histidine kinase [Anaerolineae bacterium]